MSRYLIRQEMRYRLQVVSLREGIPGAYSRQSIALLRKPKKLGVPTGSTGSQLQRRSVGSNRTRSTITRTIWSGKRSRTIHRHSPSSRTLRSTGGRACCTAATSRHKRSQHSSGLCYAIGELSTATTCPDEANTVGQRRRSHPEVWSHTSTHPIPGLPRPEPCR